MSDATQTAKEPQDEQSEGLQLSSLVTGITVDDIQASLTWYCNIVGFTVAEKFEHEGEVRFAALNAGDGQLMIMQDDWGKGKDRQKGQGMRLHLSTSQNVDEVAAGIKSRGGELASEPDDMPWGGRAFNLLDPTGFLLTISSGM